MNIADAIYSVKKELADIYSLQEIDAISFRLLEHFFDVTHNSYYLTRELTLAEKNIAPFKSALAKLKQHTPIQYVLGKTEFYGMLFHVNESVLIPRPETEELVEWVYSDNKEQQIRLLDIGTGSGCIAISLAKLISQAQVAAIDISKNALAIAHFNAKQNNANIHFIEADILSPSSMLCELQPDVIVSNPPYVRESEKALMNCNVLDFEPASALFVPDNDPLVFYRAIVNFALSSLSSGGRVYLEINEAFGSETLSLFDSTIFSSVELRNDINGKARMAKAIKR